MVSGPSRDGRVDVTSRSGLSHTTPDVSDATSPCVTSLTGRSTSQVSVGRPVSLTRDFVFPVLLSTRGVREKTMVGLKDDGGPPV